jgi:hypothetical protein
MTDNAMIRTNQEGLECAGKMYVENSPGLTPSKVRTCSYIILIYLVFLLLIQLIYCSKVMLLFKVRKHNVTVLRGTCYVN